MTTNHFDLVIVGGGPAGTGLLLKAIKEGPGNKLFRLRVALIEKSECLVKGVLTDYKINSDTLSDVFLECLEGETQNYLDLQELQEEVQTLQGFRGRSIPLHELESYYGMLGGLLKENLSGNGFCEFIMNSAVKEITIGADGTFRVHLTDNRTAFTARQVVIATGGYPHENRGGALIFAGKVPLQPFAAKTIHSDHLMKHGLSAAQKTTLRNNPRVVILGGSHGGFSAAHIMLNSTDKFDFSAKDIKIWSSSRPAIYFPSKDEALQGRYTDFTENDICPVTGRVFRLAGLRMDGRQLYMRMLGLNGYPKEDRVQLNIYTDQYGQLLEDLNAAGIVILAFGYKFNMLPVYDMNHLPVRFAGESSDHWVNDRCELVVESGGVIPGLFAMGLATGFIPSGPLGGEPTFSGQTNGIWYYQNILAEQIISQLKGADSPDLP